jgi:hypothetical protein
VKKYSTSLGSLAFVAVIEIENGPVAVGTEAKVIGFGVGAVVSVSVVAEAPVDGVVVFWTGALSRAVTV